MNNRKIPLGKDWLEDIKMRSLERMRNIAEKELNPNHYQLSSEAKKRLRWLYTLYYEQNGNVTQSARKLGISRQWLSEMKAVFEKNKKDPRSLEPESKAPKNTRNRKRIPKEVEDKILKVRAQSKNVWGKKKIAVVLLRDHCIKVNPNTVNKYLHKHEKRELLVSTYRDRFFYQNTGTRACGRQYCCKLCSCTPEVEREAPVCYGMSEYRQRNREYEGVP